MSKAKAERFASVWDAIADTPEEAANCNRSDKTSVVSRLSV